MHLISVNIGRPQPHPGEVSRGSPDTTGIYKEAVGSPVAVTAAGLAGDSVIDGRHHGGPDQAVYLYTGPDYAFFEQELGIDLPAGTFGENLTLSDLKSADVVIGDRLHIGEVVLEATAPRIPCGTFGARMAVPGFVKRFAQAQRPGVYCRVIAEGMVRPGDEVRLERRSRTDATIGDLFRAYYDKNLPASTIRHFLDAPLAGRERARLEKLLRKR